MKLGDEKNDEKKNDKLINEENKEREKNEAKRIEKDYIKLITSERANLKQLAKRKFISVKAIKQIHALLLFDKGRTMTEVMEELALSPQTLLKWRSDFKEKRMESLIVILEKKKNDDNKKDVDEKKHDDNSEKDESSSSE